MPGIGAHPRGIHLWWARRPLTTARAVIWASLIDDPSSHTELFDTEEKQNIERQRLFRILENLVDWRKSNDEAVINEAKKELCKYFPNGLPSLLDPFSGGGTIPLEAQRLGLSVTAHDLDPVAVMINKSLIEIPPKFNKISVINPKNKNEIGGSFKRSGASVIADDFNYYAKLVKDRVMKKLNHIYPLVSIPSSLGGGQTSVVSWLWTRVIKCPNPACGCEVPLIRNFTLAKKKGRISWVELNYDNDKNVSFVVHNNGIPAENGTVDRKGAKCPICGAPIAFPYIREEGKKGNLKQKLMAVVAEGKKGKYYLSPTKEQEVAALVERPASYPNAEMAFNPRNFNTPIYGMDHFADLFTNRQLVTLVTFCDEISVIKSLIEEDAVKSGLEDDHISISDNGRGATAYAEAICTYLSFAIDRLADFSTSVSRWSVTNEKAMNCFCKQAIAMTWDFPEVNILGNAVGSFLQIVDYISSCIRTLPDTEIVGVAEQHNAQSDCGLRNIVISTDPPYYDNIDYADLADFFYIWMRRVLKDIYPSLFQTMVVPKLEELVASPYRHNGNVEKAKKFFEEGMIETFRQIHEYARDDIPVTIYYAYKQTETNENEGTVSSGWETMLNAIIQSGFAITGTWPIRTEQAYRSVSMGTNSLASSIVLVCRKRDDNAPQITRRNLVNALRKQLHPALKKLQDSNIAPVDLAQSAIGPGIGVFSQYKKVLEADGTIMSVRSALLLINEEIDMFFNEQTGNMDAPSRFCIDLYSQLAYEDVKYGEAEILANAKGISIPNLVARGVLFAKSGLVHLVKRDELPQKINTLESYIWMITQQLTKAMLDGGVYACAHILKDMLGSIADSAKDLAYQLYTIAERKGWSEEAYAYNSLVVAWPDIQTRAAELKEIQPRQLELF